MPLRIFHPTLSLSLRSLLACLLLCNLLNTLAPAHAAASWTVRRGPVRYTDTQSGKVAARKESSFSIAPAGGVQGKEYEVLVNSSACPQGAADSHLDDVELYAPTGSGITAVNTNASGCRLTARLSIAPDAPLGAVQLWLRKKDNSTIGTVEFNVTTPQAGPIPPGLDKGQVDVMWSVLPENIVHDNFGKKISKEYYCIDVIVGNDSGFDLQLTSVGFTVPEVNPRASEHTAYIVPSIGYRMARGTLERAQQVGVRNRLLAFINSMGPFLTGFTPFFHAVNHRANFSEGVNIFSNPFEKGYEQTFPDTTIRQLDRLADQVWRDDNTSRTVVTNNTQLRLMTFFPRKFLYPPVNKAKRASDYDYDLQADPREVMRRLGQIVLIGEVVQHTNRIRIVSNSLLPGVTGAAVTGRVIDDCGLGVANVNVILSSDSGFGQQTEKTDSAGNYTFSNLPLNRRYNIKAALDNATVNVRDGDENFVLRDSRTVDFRAALNKAVITGKVVNKETGAGVGGITIELRKGASSTDPPTDTTTTQDDGTFKFEEDPQKVAPSDIVDIRAVPNKSFTFDPEAKKKDQDKVITWSCQHRDATFTAVPIPTPTPTPATPQ